MYTSFQNFQKSDFFQVDQSHFSISLALSKTRTSLNKPDTEGTKKTKHAKKLQKLALSKTRTSLNKLDREETEKTQHVNNLKKSIQ